jgi:peptidoglycan/LPS O-acetylase OafA/YrhL
MVKGIDTLKRIYASEISQDRTIQGLRGLAVIAVLLFHVYPKSNSSGYLGVDIFFVISGFLITRNIAIKIVGGKFNFLDFLKKRILRIFPALIFVVTTSSVIASFVLFPLELMQFSKHTLTGVNFVSNFMSARESGYFDDQTSQKPLLHLWSLSVEWQFYLIWPFVILLAMRKNLKSFNLIRHSFIVLFITYVIFYFQDKDLAFYMPFTRFWQFCLGGLIFLLPEYFSKNKFLIFFVLIVFVFTLCFGNYFLSDIISTILVTIGSAILISNSYDKIITSIFGNKILVYFGDISFSLYLLHLPLLVFIKLLFPNTEVGFEFILVLIILSHFSTKLIENPFRISKKTTRDVFYLSGSIILLSIISSLFYFGVVPYTKVPWASKPLKVGDTGQSVFFNSLFSNSYPCNNADLYENSPVYNGKKRCIQSNKGDTDIVIIGDSHAEAIYPGLLKTSDDSIRLIVRDGMPLVSNSNYYEAYQESLNGKIVIIAGRWVITQSFQKDLLRTFEFLNSLNTPVIIVGDTPSFDFDAEKCKFQRVISKYNICTDKAPIRHSNLMIEKLIDLGQYKNLNYLDFSKSFCDLHTCSMSDKSFIYFRDNNHLNLNGSEIVARQIIKFIKACGPCRDRTDDPRIKSPLLYRLS